MEKAVFIDRDGTINVDKHYLYKKEDFEYLPGAREGLKILQDLGYLLIIVTNQSGIARGYFDEEAYLELDKSMKADLLLHGINLTDSYYCPHLIDGTIKKYAIDCECRKPKLGLFERAIKDHNIDINKSIVIGDSPRDIGLAGNNKYVKGFLLYQNFDMQQENIYYMKGGLLEVAEKVKEDARMDALNNRGKNLFIRNLKKWFLSR
ncbi:MAG: HAD family hydrolase [Pseudobutyrivibrio sp.]|nr:HAD family hydrolase [Pseudobutyrivibrio sp.]